MAALFFLGLVAIGIYLAIRLSASLTAFLSGNRHRAYRLLAKHYHGRYENRGLSDPPTVSFSHKGSNVRVGLAPIVPGQMLGPRTRVVARFRQGLPFRMELAPVARPAPSQPPKGTRIVRVGEPSFDRGYVIQANDPDMARAFLTPAVRIAIEQMHRLAAPPGLLISINPERLLVQVDRNLALQSDALIQAVRDALVVLDGLQIGVASRMSQGISIVSSGPTEASEGPPLCKVCGESIESTAVICMVCKTPHHRDCWEFVGACSIYGCNGKQCASA